MKLKLFEGKENESLKIRFYFLYFHKNNIL